MKLQIIFYSMYGPIYRMAGAVAEGARQVPGANGSRQPGENEFSIARLQGQHVAEIAAKLWRGARV